MSTFSKRLRADRLLRCLDTVNLAIVHARFGVCLSTHATCVCVSRQTVQYIQPHHAAQRLGQAELLVIDEAAAIPLPLVKAMLGPYLVFLCSTGVCKQLVCQHSMCAHACVCM